MEPWNGWYHVNSSTYGHWLPGDPRGWRSKQHRVHVDGDYKNPPPPGSDKDLHEYARDLLKYPPVRLGSAHRECAGRALVDMLIAQGVEVLAISLDAVHLHLLGRFGNKRVRKHVGCAKKHATFCLKNIGHIGKLWQRSSSMLPINNRSHQVNVFKYISNHRNKGAWVWTFRDGIYWTKTITPIP